MLQWGAVEDAPEMACFLDAKQESMEQITEEQAHKVQVAALSQMQLQAMERVEAQEKELRRLSALLVTGHLPTKYEVNTFSRDNLLALFNCQTVAYLMDPERFLTNWPRPKCTLC